MMGIAPESMRQAVSAPLNQLYSSALHAVGPTSAGHKVHVAPPTSTFAECDAHISDALQTTRLHQGKQREIEQLTGRIVDLDAQLRQTVSMLSDGKAVLEEIISEGNETLSVIQRSIDGAVPHTTILTYASKIAQYTSAPPTINPLNLEPIPTNPIVPPFPTDMMMRKGAMSHEPPLGSLGETQEAGQAVSPSVLPAQQQALPGTAHGPTQYSTYAAAQQATASTDPDDLFDLDLNPDF